MIYRNIQRYKYMLTKSFSVDTVLDRHLTVEIPSATLRSSILVLDEGFMWDGSSGPAWDTENSMDASAVHDALYRMFRAGLLPVSYKQIADNLYKSLCIKGGMSKTRANYQLFFLKLLGDSASREG